MISIANILTANGNLKTDAHRNIKSQYEAKLVSALGLDATPNGSYAVQIAEATREDGSVVPVYAKVEFVITTVDPFVAKEAPVRKAKAKDPIVVPDIF